MRKIFIILMILFVTSPSYIAYSDSESNSVLKPPSINTKYALVMDYESGRILFEKNSNTVVPMASTTKIMTAIIALENSNLNDIVTISKKASSIHGSTIGLKEGQKLTMEELLYGLMLRSGNDCAIAISEFIAGDVERFASIMNSKAFDIGAFNTNFITPHGLDSPLHFTTSIDLALITKYAYNNVTFKKIVSTKDIIIDGASGKRTFHNINKILWGVYGADGVKTGYTGNAGKCLVSSASRSGKRVICVLLNSQNRWEDSKKLIDYSFNLFDKNIEINSDDYMKIIPVNYGNKSNVIVTSQDNISFPLSEEEYKHIEIKIDLPNSINAPIYCGQQVGKISIISGNNEVYSIPMTATETITEYRANSLIKNILDRFKKQNQL